MRCFSFFHCNCQAENEYQRARNQELVKLQEESSIRQEQARRATEEQIQAQRRQTEREKAEIERETIRVRAMAEAEGRAHEAKLAEEVNRRMLVDRANAEREKWVAAINTTFEHIGGTFYQMHSMQFANIYIDYLSNKQPSIHLCICGFKFMDYIILYMC